VKENTPLLTSAPNQSPLMNTKQTSYELNITSEWGSNHQFRRAAVDRKSRPAGARETNPERTGENPPSEAKIQADFLNCVGRASSRLEPTFCNISVRCSRIHAATPASIRWSSASSRMALASFSKMAALLSRAVSKCNNCSSDTPISQLIGITDSPELLASVRKQPATRLSSLPGAKGLPSREEGSYQHVYYSLLTQLSSYSTSFSRYFLLGVRSWESTKRFVPFGSGLTTCEGCGS